MSICASFYRIFAMTGRIKYAIIIIEVMNMIKKIRNLKLRNTYLLVLFFGLVSTAVGGKGRKHVRSTVISVCGA